MSCPQPSRDNHVSAARPPPTDRYLLPGYPLSRIPGNPLGNPHVRIPGILTFPENPENLKKPEKIPPILIQIGNPEY
jgi:hypothetical protein